MSHPERIVIIGAGLAGASAAAALREGGYTGEVRMFGAERHQPYELPPLSKGMLLGEADEPDWVREPGFFSAHDVDFRSGVRATGIELGSRLVTDDAGQQHGYDRLLLATGSVPRMPRLPGADLPGLRTLRSIEDSLALRAAFERGGRVVIVGAGWIGTEAAAAARGHGAEVTVVDQISLPLRGVLGDEVAGVFRDLHAAHGVDWRLGAGVSEFESNGDGVSGVRLTDGTLLDADTVLVAVGAAPNTGLAHAAGLELADDGGIDVDAGLRTATPDVYAAGDVAAHFHPRYGARVRVEHWANAKNQGAHVAGNLLGAHEPYVAAPYFFSDQYDLGCEYRGIADVDNDQLVVRGDLAAREFTAFWLRDSQVAAAMNVNVWDDGAALKALVDGRATVTADQLRTADLAGLAG